MHKLTLVTRSLSDDGWVVTWQHGLQTFYADNGGSWILHRDGSLGRQTQGTSDVRIPRTPAAIKKFLQQRAAYEGEAIDVIAPKRHHTAR